MKTLAIIKTYHDDKLVNVTQEIYDNLENILDKLNSQEIIYIRVATFANPMIDGQTVIINALI